MPIVFAIIFIVGAILYYSYAFTASSKIDFDRVAFYLVENSAQKNGDLIEFGTIETSKKDSMNLDSIEIYEPQSKSFSFCIFSSRNADFAKFFERENIKNSNILAIDFYQNEKINGFKNIKLGTDSLLALVREFEIISLPFCAKVSQSPQNPRLYERPKQKGIYKILNFRKGENYE